MALLCNSIGVVVGDADGVGVRGCPPRVVHPH